MKNKENKSERVCVHLRMRPLSEEEKMRDKINPIETFDTEKNIITVKKDYEKKTFYFDNLLHPDIFQNDVFDRTGKSVVESVLKGYNGTIFAYGQTGTGKTFTMVGDFQDENKRGIIPRSFEYIFKMIKQDKEFKYNISISFIQIYLEIIQDLLEPLNENIRIREDPELGVYLEGVEWVKVSNLQECHLVFEAGEKNRATASTKMNAHSSRSHAIMIVRIEKTVNYSPEKLKEIQSNSNLTTDKSMTKSNLFLVDLAGSERVKKTRADAMRLEEAKKINFSLLVLGNCIQSLSDAKSSHVNYRDSKLTRLLQESLGGNAKTSLIVTISPAYYNVEETVSSLMFGQRAMKVQNKPLINKTVDYQALSIKLQEDLDKLNDEYSKIKIEYEKVLEENNKLKNSDTYLEMQRKSFLTNIDKIASTNVSMELSQRNPNEKCAFKMEGSSNKTMLINNQQYEDLRKHYEEEMKKLENSYREVQKNQEAEHEKFIQEIDKVLVEKENEIDEARNEILGSKQELKKLKILINDFDKEKDDLQKTILQMNGENEELNKNLEQLTKNIKILEEENAKFKTKVVKDVKTRSVETDNSSYNQKIIDLAINTKLMVENEQMNINIIERLIFFLDSEYKNASKYLENKNADYLKLIKFQKEKDDEHEHEISILKQFKEKEFHNSMNFKIEKQNLEDEIKELKEKLEKLQKDYEKDCKNLKDQIGFLQDSLNSEKRKISNLIEENKYKETIIDEKDKSIAQLLNQIAEADVEIEHNEKLRKELTILQNDLFNTQKKLKQSNNSEQEMKTKLNIIETNMNNEINEKKKLAEDLDKISKEKDFLLKEKESLVREKNSSSSDHTDLKNKLNEKINKIKFLEEKIVELSTNNTNSKATIESSNKKITEFENKIIILNKEKNELSTKFENDIKLLKASHFKEIENCKNSYEKDCSILKAKFENDMEIIKNNFNKQIESLNGKSKTIDEKYKNLSPFLTNLSIFYEESEGMISTNQTNMTTMLEKFSELKTNFSLLESTIEEISMTGKEACSPRNKIDIMKNNKIIDASAKEGFISEKAKNFEKVKEKIEKILTKSDDILSQTSMNFSNMDKIKKKNIKKNSTSEMSSALEETINLLDKMNFNSLKIKLNDFLNGLNIINESFYFFFNIMIKVIKTSHDFTLNYITTHSVMTFKDKNQSLEIELMKKNENYLKNGLIALNQKIADKVSTLVSNNKELEKSINMFQLFSSKNSSDLSALEIYKFSNDFTEEIFKHISNFIDGKDMEIQNLNEKIIYYLREIDLIKNAEKDKGSNISNIQVIKLQSQLKLKEDEILRLNQRIEEHVKSIKSLKADINEKSNKNLCLNTTNIVENSLKLDSSRTEMKTSISPSKAMRENILEKMNLYEEEINTLKSQITEQKQNFQLEKDELLKTKQMFDKFKKKDADTGKFLIKEYFSKTSDLMIDFYKTLNGGNDSLFS